MTVIQTFQIETAKRLPLHANLRIGKPSPAVHQEMEQLLGELRTSTQERGWDGYEAEQVSETTYALAKRFVALLPGNMMPSLGAEPDGHVTFEWYRDPGHILSVSIGPDAMLYYAALLGRSRRSGTEPFNGQIPEEIVQLAKRVQAR